jgi:hypothetical protein
MASINRHRHAYITALSSLGGPDRHHIFPRDIPGYAGARWRADCRADQCAGLVPVGCLVGNRGRICSACESGEVK